MRKGFLDVAVAVLFLAVAIYGVYSATQLRMSLGSQVGPGVFPLGATALLAMLAAVHLALVLIDRRRLVTDALREQHAAIPERAVWRQLLVLCSLVLAILLLRRVGYLLAMATLVGLSLVAFDERRPLVVGAIALAVTAVSYLLFAVALGVRIPLWPVF